MFTKMAAQTKTKKREEIIEEVSIPENVHVSMSGATIHVKGPKGELKLEFSYPGVSIEKVNSKVVLKTSEGTKKRKAVIGSIIAHLNNMFKGVSIGFKYKLKIVFSHFPITTKVVRDHIEISNYLGEKSPRKAKIFGNVKVTAGKEEIVIEGINVEEVGQTAANLEQTTRVRYRDPRIFQDGIYLVSKE